MDFASALNTASFVVGLLSAAFWVRSATVKVDPPPEFKELADNMYYGHIIVNGADLIPTMKKQALWNSVAAIAAAATVLLQIGVKLLE